MRIRCFTGIAFLLLSSVFPAAAICNVLLNEPNYLKSRLMPYVDLISMDQRCYQGARDLLSNLENYQHFLGVNNYDFAAGYLRKLHADSENFIQGEPDCFNALAHTYAVASVSMVSRASPGPYGLLALFLSNQGQLRPIHPGERSQWGGIWSKKTDDQRDFLIFGAYDCELSTIVFDPTLPPLDLGAAMIHELDHFMRDKLYNPDGSGLTSAEYVIIDELLSLTHAGFQQLRLHTTTRIPDMKKAFHVISLPMMASGYNVPWDMTLFSKKGKLMFLWNQAKLKQEDQLFLSSTEFMSKEIFLQGFSGGKQEKERIKQANLDLLSLTVDAYFSEEKPRVLQNPKLPSLWEKIRKIGLDIDPLARWITEEDRWKDLWKQPVFDSASMKSTPSMIDELIEAINQWPEKYKIRSSLMDELGKRFMPLTDKLLSESPACVFFKNAITKGELNGYLGFNPKNGTKLPGTDGLRPGDSTPRPCRRPPARF